MKPDKLYCGTCGEEVDIEGKFIQNYPTACTKCGAEFRPKDIRKVAWCGLLPGCGQIANEDLMKAMGIMILTFIAFMVGLAFFIIGGFILASIVVVSADLAAVDRATRYAGYSKEAPTVYNTNKR